MKIVSFGKFSVISSDTIECGGGRDDDSFINILQNDSIIFTSSDIPELKTDQVYYALPVKDETIVGINRFKVSLTKSGSHISFSKKGEGELKTVSGYVGWSSSVDGSKFIGVKGIKYQDFDTIRIYSSGELPYPLVEDKTYSITNATESSFQVTNETCGEPISFKNKGQGVHFFKFSLVGVEGDGTLKATYTPLITPVRNYHITDLRTRINNELIRRGKPTFTFTDPTLTVGTTPVKTYHVQELRTAAQQIAPYITLNMTDNPLIACVTKIKAIHLQEIDNYVTAREAQVKVTCTWNYTSSSAVTIPACAANDPICVWGIGGGGGGGAGGTGGTGGTGGSGGCGGRGTYSGVSYGGCGGRGGIGREYWGTGIWPASFSGPGVAGGGGGGGGGGAGVPARQGYGGWGGGAGTAGAGGAGGGGGTAGAAGSGNIASYPASACIIPAGSLNLCVRVGSGGGSGSSGSNSFVCCTSGALLFNVAGGGGGSTGSTGGNGGPGTNGANQTGFPAAPGVDPGGYNGACGGDAGFAGMNTGASPNCIWGGVGGAGGMDGGNGPLAGGGGGGGGGSYNWAYKGTRYSWGGAGGGGKAGGSGGGAGGVLSSDSGVVVGGAGGTGGGYYGTNGSAGTIIQCSTNPPPKTLWTVDWGPGIGTNPSGGNGGSSGAVCYTANCACYYTGGGGGGCGAPWYPGAGTPGDGGDAGGARTARAGGSGGAGGAGGPCGWFGYGCGGTGGTGGTGGYGGYGGAGGAGGAGAPSVPGGYGGSGGCGSWARAYKAYRSCYIYAYCYGTYGAGCQSYASSVGAWGEGGEPGGPGDGGGPGNTGGSGYVRLNFSVWV